MKYVLYSGTDNLKEIETWYRVEELINTFKVMVLKRDNDNVTEIINNHALLRKYKGSFIELNNIEQIKLSSSYVREKIAQGENADKLVPQEIQEDVIRIYSKM